MLKSVEGSLIRNMPPSELGVILIASRSDNLNKLLAITSWVFAHGMLQRRRSLVLLQWLSMPLNVWLLSRLSECLPYAFHLSRIATEGCVNAVAFRLHYRLKMIVSKHRWLFCRSWVTKVVGRGFIAWLRYGLAWFSLLGGYVELDSLLVEHASELLLDHGWWGLSKFK